MAVKFWLKHKDLLNQAVFGKICIKTYNMYKYQQTNLRALKKRATEESGFICPNLADLRAALVGQIQFQRFAPCKTFQIMKLWLVGHTFIFLFCWCLFVHQGRQMVDQDLQMVAKVVADIPKIIFLPKFSALNFPLKFFSPNFPPEPFSPQISHTKFFTSSQFCEFIHQEAYSSDEIVIAFPISAFVRRAEVILS